MSDSTTTNYGWAYPTVNADEDTWGTTLNNAIIAIDGQMFTNLGLSCLKANNLSDVGDATTSRNNLGLSVTAVLPASTGSGYVVNAVPGGGITPGNLAIFQNTNGSIQDLGVAYNNIALLSNNLSDLASASSARSNLGLGSIATHNITISSSSPSGGSDGDIWLQYS